MTAQLLVSQDHPVYSGLLEAIYGELFARMFEMGYYELTYREVEILETWLHHPDLDYSEMALLILKRDGKPISVSSLKAHIQHISTKLYISGRPAALERYRLLRSTLGPRSW